MTDKVQKILSEITTRKLCTMDEHMAFYNDKAKEDYRLLSEIEEVIKALQEEPKFKIGDRVKIKGMTAKGDVIRNIYQAEDGNTYFEFENSDDAPADCDWELVEEPKKCMYTKDHYTDEDRKVLCDGCEEDCEYSKKEELVSEDLEEAAWFYADMKACLDKSVFTQKEVNEKRSKLEYNWEDIRLAFKAGAERQFERVKEALLSEVLPCFMRGGEADEVVAKLEEVLNQKK